MHVDTLSQHATRLQHKLLFAIQHITRSTCLDVVMQGSQLATIKCQRNFVTTVDAYGSQRPKVKIPYFEQQSTATLKDCLTSSSTGC